MQYDRDAVVELIEEAVGREDRRPAFYAVGGSRMYGFAGEDADVDVRGFHVADGQRYALLDEPEEQVVVNQGEVTPGFEAYAGTELVSYELKKFGSLVLAANFNVLEPLFDGDEVLNRAPAEIDALRGVVEAALPLDVPRTYVGMARSNYRRYLDPGTATYAPTPKRYLYALRGLLAAIHVAEEGRIEADVRVLARRVLGTAGTEVVDELIEAKVSGGEATVRDDLAERADDLFVDLLGRIEPPERVEKEGYRREVNEWMSAVRRSGP